jgi:hypothetical protein
VLYARGATLRVAPSSSVLEVLLRALRGEIWFLVILQCATFDSLIDAGLGSAHCLNRRLQKYGCIRVARRQLRSWAEKTRGLPSPTLRHKRDSSHHPSM